MVKTRRGDSTLDDLDPAEDVADANNAQNSSENSADDDLFKTKPRMSLRSREGPEPESLSRPRGQDSRLRTRHTRFVYKRALSSDEFDDDMEQMENHTEESSPNIRNRSRRQARKHIIGKQRDQHSSGDDDEEEITRTSQRRLRGLRYPSNKSYSFRSISNEHEGPRRSGRQRTTRYSYNDAWLLDEQPIRYRRHRERETMRHAEPLVNHSHYSLRRHKAGGSKNYDEDLEEDPEEVIRPKRSVRIKQERENDSAADATNSQKEDGEEEKEDEEEENQNEEEKDEREKAPGEEDMYTRVKRNRRTGQTISFSEDVRPTRKSKRNTITSGDESGSSDDQQSRPPSPRKGYHLRQRRPPPANFQMESLRRSTRSRNDRNRTLCRKDSSSSSSSDSDYDKRKKNRRCLSVSYSQGNSRRGDRKKNRSNLADTDPMEINPDIKFSNVGGLAEHIKALKEMIVFPMMYSEVFEKFKITPPKGVLFHGPPGTGKTLMARALANECSQGDQKVSFFMRKGADCLSKWVGESERQLRLLFDEAYQSRPSIIFFDELDGLAPVRSCKQDQIHASIVSTLLALMDGLKDRQEIIIIGATNRIDSIDPALRRPGRFDRELFFPLPAIKEREEILRIHMAKWEEQAPPELITELAGVTDGYCGADLKALCSEAVLQSLRRRYPQIYNSEQKLLLDINQVQVQKIDFLRAKTEITPAAQRMAKCPGKKLPQSVSCLLKSEVEKAAGILADQFPHVNLVSAAECKLMPALVPNPRLLLTGTPHQPHSNLIAPALLNRMEHVTVHSMDMSSLYGTPGASPEEVCIQVFREAARQLPAVIYVPNIDKWCRQVPETVREMFVEKLSLIDPNTAILLLATANEDFESEDMPETVQELFNPFRDEVCKSKNPSLSERKSYFAPLFEVKPFEVSKEENKVGELEILPLAPPPKPRKLSEQEEKTLYKAEENSLRELRIFLRQTLDKLTRNKKFSIFFDPVDKDDAPDYYDIIKEPMDLATMYDKVNKHQYNCAEDFMLDIKQISQNCLEYNPDKHLRATACQFTDVVHAVIKTEMDTDFEEECKKISENRKQRNFNSKKYLMDFIYVAPAEGGKDKPKTETENTEADETLTESNPLMNGTAEMVNGEVEPPTTPASTSQNLNSESRQKKRKSRWSSGVINKPKKKKAPEAKDKGAEDLAETDTSLFDSSILSASSKNSPVKLSPGTSPKSATSTPKASKACPFMTETMEVVASMLDATEEATLRVEPPKVVEPNREGLAKCLKKTLDLTDGLPFVALQDLHTQLNLVIVKGSKKPDQSKLHLELEKRLQKFSVEQKPKYLKYDASN